jgi:hypothetical protein
MLRHPARPKSGLKPSLARAQGGIRPAQEQELKDRFDELVLGI